MMTKKKRRLLLISIIILVVIIIIAAFTIIYLKTDKFKSNQTLFFKYLGKNIDTISQLQSIQTNEENNNAYKSTVEAKINYTTNLGKTSEDTSNSINQLKLKIESQIDENNQYDYKKMQLQNGENVETTIEYLQNQNVTGIRFGDLFGQYISANNTGISELMEKIGYNNDELATIINLLNMKENSLNEFNFSEEELETIRQTYIKIISDNVSSSNFSKQSNMLIKIKDKNFAVNAYSLNLTKEELNNIYIKLLEQVKQDEIILNKLDKIQEKISAIKESTNSDTNIKEKFIEKIEKTIKEINSNNIGSETTKIIVYENKKQTVRTAIQTPDYEIDFDYTNLDGEQYVNIEKLIEEKNEKSFTFDKTDEKSTITIENNNNEENPITISFGKTNGIQNNKQVKKYLLKYEDKSQRAELNATQEIDETINDEKENFTTDNAVNLSNLNEEQAKQIQERVKSGVNEKKEKVKENIKIDDIVNMLKNIGIMKEDTKLNSQGATEAEINRYNSKYEILQGEKLDGEKVITMIDTIKDNISGIQLVSGEELRLEINENEGNEQVVGTLKTYFDKNKDRQYNAKVEYDENKFVKYINLTILPKEE